MGVVKEHAKRLVRGLARPIGDALARFGISANVITVLGALACFPSAYGFYTGNRALAFSGLFLSGLFDLLDGAVARAGGRRGTSFGAALDSTLDRYGEGLVLGGILLGLAARDASPWILSMALLAGVGSFLVSYVRARSEGLGIPCEVGLLERPERWVILLLLAALGDRGAPILLSLLAILTHVTFLQRLVHVARASGRGAPPRDLS